jgi:hypothetical protein
MQECGTQKPILAKERLMRILIFFLLLLCIAQMGCRESSTNQPVANSQQTATDASISPSNSNQANIPAPPETALVKAKVDACALLTGSEIASVQGENIKETKLSGQNFRGYSISQCFFTLPTFTNSISLMVAQKGDGAGGKDPKEFWQENFHEQAGKKGKTAEGKAGKKTRLLLKRFQALAMKPFGPEIVLPGLSTF